MLSDLFACSHAESCARPEVPSVQPTLGRFNEDEPGTKPTSEEKRSSLGGKNMKSIRKSIDCMLKDGLKLGKKASGVEMTEPELSHAEHEQT